MKKEFAVLLVVASLLTQSCSSSSSSSSSESVQDTQSNAPQSAMAAASNQSGASEGGSAGKFFDGPTDSLVDGGDIQQSRTVACNYASVRSCSSGTGTITWNSCTVDGGRAVMTGGWSEAFSGTSASSCTTPLVSGESVTRTTSSSVITMASGASLTTDTSGGTAYDGTVISGSGTTIAASGGGPTRTITINGTHKVKRGPLGSTWFDHFIKTTSALSVTGSRSGGNRVISSGTVVVYHQLAKYQASNVFSSVTWGTPSCCYPTSGTIASTFTGSVTGSGTLNFAPGAGTCGQASYTDTTGTTSIITLEQCN